MADSFTPLLNLRLQQTGGNTNTWGDLLNSDVITALDNAVAGVATHAVTGGALDLSATPLVHQVHGFTGILTSDLTVTIPNLAKRMVVSNSTSGAFVMLIKTAAGSTVQIPQGTTKDVISLGGNIVLRMDQAEVGEIKHFGSSAVPSGYLECDGSAISRTGYPQLFAALGTTWGAGNGSTTFNLPDLKTAGRFLRSRTGSVAAGTYQLSDIEAHSHTASASTTITSLSIAADGAWTPSISISDPTHSHIINRVQGGGSGALGHSAINTGSTVDGLMLNAGTAINLFAEAVFTGVTASSSTAPTHVHSGSTGTASTSVTVNNSTGTETRPVNASALAAIRY